MGPQPGAADTSLFLILPLGLSPTLTSVPCLPLSPSSSPLPLSAVPVSVSRTFAFSRGDSLAGSPGNGAWLWAGTSACARLFPAPCAGCSKLPPPCMPGSTGRGAPTAPHSGQPLTGWSMSGRLGTAALPQPPQYDANPGKNGIGTRGSHRQLRLSWVCSLCNFLHSVIGFSCYLLLLMTVTCKPCMHSTLLPWLSGNPGDGRAF